jgi:hypothetical protein
MDRLRRVVHCLNGVFLSGEKNARSGDWTATFALLFLAV